MIKDNIPGEMVYLTLESYNYLREKTQTLMLLESKNIVRHHYYWNGVFITNFENRDEAFENIVKELGDANKEIFSLKEEISELKQKSIRKGFLWSLRVLLGV